MIDKIYEIPPHQAFEVISNKQKNFCLIDVRNFEEIAQHGKIMVSTHYEHNIPWYSDHFENNMEALLQDMLHKVFSEQSAEQYPTESAPKSVRDDVVSIHSNIVPCFLFICAHGVRSLQAAKFSHLLAKKILEGHGVDDAVKYLYEYDDCGEIISSKFISITGGILGKSGWRAEQLLMQYI